MSNDLLATVEELKALENVGEAKCALSISDIFTAASEVMSGIQAVYTFIKSVDWSALDEEGKALWTAIVNLYEMVVNGVKALFSGDATAVASLQLNTHKMNVLADMLKVKMS